MFGNKWLQLVHGPNSRQDSRDKHRARHHRNHPLRIEKLEAKRMMASVDTLETVSTQEMEAFHADTAPLLQAAMSSDSETNAPIPAKRWIEGTDTTDSITHNIQQLQSLNVDTLAGNDFLNVLNTGPDGYLSVDLGSGNDTLAIDFENQGLAGDFDGGPGTDTFTPVASTKTPFAALRNFEVIDLSAENSPSIEMLSATDVVAITDESNVLRIKHDANDQVTLNDDWEMAGPTVRDEVFLHRFSSRNAMVEIENDRHHQNPMEPLDVDADGEISALDVLRVINRMNRYSDRVANHNRLREITDVAHFDGNYVDTNGDNMVTAVDALLVINALNRPKQEHAELVLLAPPIQIRLHVDASDAASERSREDVADDFHQQQTVQVF